MNKNRTFRERAPFAAVLLAVLGAVALWPSTASAQLGSLVVTVTSPGAGSTVGGTVTMNAQVTVVGLITVRGVQFFVDGASVGAEDTTSPYSVPWNTTTASNGSHVVTAVARDLLGLGWTSNPVTVTVFNDTTPPVVSITFPSAGGTLTGTVAVSGSASDNVGVVGVQFRLDGANLGAEDTTSPYAVSWNTATASNGSHTLTAVARDAAGNTTTSSGVTVTVDNLAPTVAMTAPASGAAVRGTLGLAASASDNVGVAGVQFRLDGANLGAEDTTSPYGLSWNSATASNGSHTLTAVARDGAGNTTTSAGITVSVDNLAPTVAITAPSGGATVGGTTAVSASASDNAGVVGVQFRLDGANLGGEDTTSPYGVSWDTTTTSSGSHTLTAVARDAAGNTTTSGGVTVTVANDTTPPSVSITAPSGGATVSGTISVSASASDNVGVVGVQFRLDGANLGGEDTTSPYGVSWNTTTASSGTHTLSAVARDAAGNTTTSGGVTVTVSNDTAPPSVSITAPAGGSTVGGMTVVSASASDNVGVAGVQFLVDGNVLGAEDTSAPYSVTWDTTTVAAGTHTLSASARDAAGNTTTSAPVTVTVAQTQTFTRFEDTDLSITYTDGVTAPGQPAGWWHGSRSRAWSNKIASFNRSQGARARFTFTGSTVRWIGFRAPWAGIARVYVDDVFVTELDLYTPTEQVQSVVYSATGLTNAPHAFTVESTGRKNDASGDYAVVVDAFDVSPPSPPTVLGTRVEETGLSLSAGWTPAAPAGRAWSGGSASTSATLGAQATLSFAGTEVRWIGFRGPATGIARVFLDGAYDADVDTYAPSETQAVVYVATGLAAGRHTLRIDVTGQRNAASTGADIVVDAVDARGRVEDWDPSIAFTGSWILNNFAKDWSGSSPNEGSGSTALSRTAGAQATVSFDGTEARWIGLRGPSSGIASVLVDGVHVADVDTYAPAEEIQAVLYAATGLAAGPHTMTVEITGQRNPASIDSLVIVDAFDLTLSPSAPSFTRFQQTDTSVTYTGSWTQGTTFNYWSGQTASFSGAAGARATFAFTGTAVRFIGQRSFNGGIARVLLDGVEVAQVDTFAPNQEEFYAALYSATGLAPGSHTLAIEATGDKAPASQNNWVIVDAFDIH